MINILQIGIGPLGLKIAEYIAEKKSMQTIAALDINPAIGSKDLEELTGSPQSGLKVHSTLESIENLDEVDIAVLTTSSSMEAITPQIENILEWGIPIVSTCEELTFPYRTNPELASKVNKLAIEKNVAVVSTGVNPGFLMDTLPSMLTGVCKEVSYIHVNRFQDAITRRVPFQKKIGAGISLEEFENRKNAGTLRHVGLTESMQFIADSIGWEIDHTEDIISPVIASETIETEVMKIPQGFAMGVRQIGTASYKGKEKIKLVFEAAVGTGTSYDEIKISGKPDIHSRIEGGVHGDIATCSIVLNAIPNVLKSSPGLKTMKDLSIVSYVH